MGARGGAPRSLCTWNCSMHGRAVSMDSRHYPVPSPSAYSFFANFAPSLPRKLRRRKRLLGL